MGDQKFSFSGSFQKAKEYIDTEIELLKLKAMAKGGRIIGALILDATKLLLTLIIIFFLSLALGFFLGEVLGSNALGFLTTGGVFLVILLIIRAVEPKLEAKFMDITIRKVLGKWHQDEDAEEESKEEGSFEEKVNFDSYNSQSDHKTAEENESKN
ncbi:Putative Holin-X, holin superfamily III [Sphingobacterium nematocida]|uniref:Putative Holin-X, holin superfamily III n=1 Tax=Sphingobacterium nematocida TaxID=1513896 RepID=A0A1T5D665_9SPHI|nr:phage holin family protein [Sphingobacterium nematocida]SKB66990.1 Putative Holin-X, holin superfamily III [Sphingobacterium nematocida]